MSGKPAGSWTLLMAAVVITPPRSRPIPNPDCGVAADGCWAEPIRERPLEEACAPIKVPLSYHQDRHWARFLEGCPANHAILSLRIPARPMPMAVSVALSIPATSYVNSAAGPDRFARTGISWLP